MLKHRKENDKGFVNTNGDVVLAEVAKSAAESNVKDGINVTYDIDRISLKRRIGLFGGISFIIGGIIGSGIFISPKGALENTGSVGLCLFIWVVSGALSTLIALVYAELGVILPKSGGDYSIIKSGIGDAPAFLYSWTQVVLSSPGGRTVQALVFADYVCAPIFTSCGTPNGIRKAIAATALLLLAITNTVSVRLVASIQGVFTVLKVGALVVITFGGFVMLIKDGTDNFNDSFDGSTSNITSITLAIYSCMWAYSGYQSLNDICEELREPKRTIPRAIILSMIIVTLIYIATNVSYFIMLSKSEFLSSSAVAFLWASKVLGPAAIIIPISVMCSVYGSSNGGFFSAIRVPFAAARAGHFPEVASFLHVRTNIPVAAVVLSTGLSLLLLIPADVTELINLVSFIGFLTQSLSIISLLRMRYNRRNKERKPDEFRVPLAVPVVALAICMFMFISPLVSNPRVEFLYGIGLILSGLLLYIPFVKFGWVVPGCNTVTLFSQLCLQIAPTVREEGLNL